MTVRALASLLAPVLERWLGVVLAIVYVAWLLATTHDLGYARDEGFYFQASQRYQAWFELLFQNPERALDPAVRDYHWSFNREHPAFIKTLFAASHWLLHQKLAWFQEAGTAYRFVGMLMAGIALVTLYGWARSTLGTTAAAVASVAAFALMPRIFYHAHLACFDVPVASLWLVTSYAYWRSLVDHRWRWPLATGVFYGLLLNTKHNSWLLPPVLTVHCVLHHVLHHVLLHVLHRVRQRTQRGLWVLRPIPGGVKALICMATLGPLLFYAGWPWIWRDTLARLTEYVSFHTGHDYYNMEFLGRTYYKPPMPRLYAWVMTLATVPATTLVLFLIGVGCWGTRLYASVQSSWRARVPASSLPKFPEAADQSQTSPISTLATQSTLLLWVMCLLASYAPWLSSNTPIFGGTKHWITAYPFMALFAGSGVAWLQRKLDQHPRRSSLSIGAAVVIALPPFVMTVESHPYGLSAYTPLVGGAPGAANLGLNRTFWGYTTGSLQDTINDIAPGGATLYLHDTARASFAMLQRDGRIRRDIRPTLDIAASDLALYHHEPHMGRVEYQIWVDYGTHTPVAIGTFQGVPVVWLYQRPR